MRQPHTRPFVVIALLVAAAACYADVPRLHVVSGLGDMINAARMLDAMSHIRLVQRASTPDELSDLDEGRQSLELVNANPRLPAALPQFITYRAPTLAPQDPGVPAFHALVHRPGCPFAGATAARPPPPTWHSHAPMHDPCRGVRCWRGPPAVA